MPIHTDTHARTHPHSLVPVLLIHTLSSLAAQQVPAVCLEPSGRPPSTLENVLGVSMIRGLKREPTPWPKACHWHRWSFGRNTPKSRGRGHNRFRGADCQMYWGEGVPRMLLPTALFLGRGSQEHRSKHPPYWTGSDHGDDGIHDEEGGG